jgi:hypothetical protein
MARKDRVPVPRKRPQGPQRRGRLSSSRDQGGRRRILYLIVGGVIAALAGLLAVVVLAGGGSDERSSLQGSACTLESFPAQPNESDHSDVPTLDTEPTWNSSPPTSGPHYGRWAPWDFYDEEVPLVLTVHNLEHGGVVIHYGPQFPKGEVDKLREWYTDDPNGLVVGPLSTNKDKVTLSAWTAPDATTGSRDRGRGWLATCPRFDEEAFDAFVEEHRYKGPERLLPEQLAPGS